MRLRFSVLLSLSLAAAAAPLTSLPYPYDLTAGPLSFRAISGPSSLHDPYRASINISTDGSDENAPRVIIRNTAWWTDQGLPSFNVGYMGSALTGQISTYVVESITFWAVYEEVQGIGNELVFSTPCCQAGTRVVEIVTARLSVQAPGLVVGTAILPKRGVFFPHTADTWDFILDSYRGFSEDHVSISEFGFAWNGYITSPSHLSIPEPGTWWMMVAGLALTLGFKTRRFRRARQR
jgi:hypothetical protein